MEIINSFRLWLQNKNYSDSTVRNYVVDINKYLDFIRNSKLEIGNSIELQTYISSISSDPNYPRTLSSLSKFFQFALDQGLVSSNPINKIKNKINQEPKIELKSILEQYQISLVKKNSSVSTIRNYINDIQQFINWIQSTPAP